MRSSRFTESLYVVSRFGFSAWLHGSSLRRNIFDLRALDVLLQPMEDKHVTISRAAGSARRRFVRGRCYTAQQQMRCMKQIEES